MSNVPPLEILPTGVVVPESVDIRQGILEDMNEAFGGDLDIVTPSTPQAYLADKLTDNIRDSNAAIAYMISQVDPATSEGRMQDGVGRIYFLDRKGATSSVVTALMTGQPNTTVPAGSLAEDDDGNLWSSTGDVTFPIGGTANGQFACVTTGPIQLGIGTLTRIAQLVPGWDAITNLSPAIVGSNVESRADYELRRQLSVARGAHGTPAAIRAAVFSVDGVIDCFVYDNYTNSQILYGATNYPIPAHSIYIGVVGGLDDDIAAAIQSRKDAGCGMTGNTSVNVPDTDYSYPQPVYVYQFNRPDSLPVKFLITIANTPGLPSNIEDLAKQEVIATLAGTNGAQRARMGGQIFASSYYGPISSISTAVSIIGIKVGTVTANLDSLNVGIDQEPTVTESDITVVIV
jgi:uncharacterized phage protein gp47/JayE